MPRGEYLQYGGQAIVEGVMMRSPRFFSVACRAPNGEIVIQTEAIEKTWIGRQKWLQKPFLRGTFALLDAMTLGIRAMRFAADVQVNDKYADPNAPKPEPKPVAPRGQRLMSSAALLLAALAIFAIGFAFQRQLPFLEIRFLRNLLMVALAVMAFAGGQGLVSAARGDEVEAKSGASNNRIQDVAIGATMIFSLVFGLFLFNYVPNLVAEYGQRAIKTQDFRVTNLIAEIVKVVIFLGYIGLIGLMPEIRRVFQYHGAEHKAINTLEADEALTMEHCKAQTRLHPRCGTSFAMIVLILGLLLFTFVPRYPVTGMPGKSPVLDVTVRFAIELMLLPLIAGTAYELLRIAGKFRNQAIVNAAFKPGIWSQYLTTREPDETQIEVALASLKACIDAEEATPSR